jgi:hypothetical protein
MEARAKRHANFRKRVCGKQLSTRGGVHVRDFLDYLPDER